MSAGFAAYEPSGYAPPTVGSNGELLAPPKRPISNTDQQQLDLANMRSQSQSDIATNAQKGLAQQQFGFDTQSTQQKASIASAAAIQASQLGMQQHKGEAELQAAAERRRLGEIPNLLQTFNSSLNMGGAGGSLPNVDFGGAIAGEDAANNAAYARSKDIAGQQGRAALDALHDTMGARGLTGSGISQNRSGGVIGAANSNLQDINREQLIQSLAANRARASEQYQGGIAQRGQDVSLRGQNLQAQTAFLNPMLGLITARY